MLIFFTKWLNFGSSLETLPRGIIRTVFSMKQMFSVSSPDLCKYSPINISSSDWKRNYNLSKKLENWYGGHLVKSQNSWTTLIQFITIASASTRETTNPSVQCCTIIGKIAFKIKQTLRRYCICKNIGISRVLLFLTVALCSCNIQKLLIACNSDINVELHGFLQNLAPLQKSTISPNCRNPLTSK